MEHGYPLVDACMRSLNVTGWLDASTRCIVLCFLGFIYDPRDFTLQHVFDFEPGIHWSQMQMQSGTTDQYFGFTIQRTG